MARLLSTFVLLFALTGCASLGGGLTGVLSQLSNFAGGVTSWQQALPAVIGDTQLGQLGQFVKQAGGLKDTVTSALEGAEAATQNGFTGVLGSLGKMSGIDVDALKGFGNEERQQAAAMFGQTAGDLGTSVEELMNSGLPGIGG